MEQSDTSRKTKQASKKTSIDPIVAGAGFSVLLSWYYFFAKGDKQRGLFVGLWPPTLMAFAGYFRGARMEDMLERHVSTVSPSGVVSRVQEILQEQS